MSSIVWVEITFPFPNFNGSSVEVWEWISNIAPRFLMDLIINPWSILVQGAPEVWGIDKKSLVTLWDVITHTGTIFNYVWAQLTSQLGHGWVNIHQSKSLHIINCPCPIYCLWILCEKVYIYKMITTGLFQLILETNQLLSWSLSVPVDGLLWHGAYWLAAGLEKGT